MGKKVKVGKQRRDKAYWSAKELGFRSRASFKLVQLNRKHEFLQKSRVCIDLCAAPGSWMQVAKEHMPMSSLIIGVDLVPIKPIPGCIAIQGDITTDKCRTDLKKELQTWKADLVLHDGAPNVGKNWLHDAYQQALLTLHSFKLATEFLRKGGSFVTKVFRSKDYQSLIWVFNQFFKSVSATKPAASRNESAEIFVVCLGYKAPDKIDPRFFDAKHMFSDVEPDNRADVELANPEKKKKKAPAEGYETGQTLLYKKAAASDFIGQDKPIHVLNNCHEIVLDEARIRKHPKTTPEVVECCKDIRVLGMKELRLLKKWREVLKSDFAAAEKARQAANVDKAAAASGSDSDNNSEGDEDDDGLEDEIVAMKDEERRTEKRKRKRSLKEKKKTADRINLKMVIPGDEGLRREEDGLFQMAKVRDAAHLDKLVDAEMPASDSDDSDEESSKPKTKRYDKGSGRLDKSGLYYKESDESEESGSESDAADSGNEDLGLEEGDVGSDVADDEDVDKLNDASENPLLVSMEAKNDRRSRMERKADLWFDKDIFKGIEDDDDLEDADVRKAIADIEKKGGEVKQKQAEVQRQAVVEEKPKKQASKRSNEAASQSDDDTDSSSSSDSDEDDSEEIAKIRPAKASENPDGFEVVKKRKKIVLTPEELALGQEMIRTKKARRDIMDAGWNRYMFDDKDSDLPDWFVREEEIHMRRRPDVDPSVVAYYKERQRDVNVKTIKKVIEAKARKKRKLTKRMDKAKKRAANIIDNADIGSREKANEIKKLYKKAADSVKKKDVAYVVAKKYNASKRAKRPAGVKGLYKQVDPRMKKDNQKKRTNASGKRNQVRRLKGKKTRAAGPAQR